MAWEALVKSTPNGRAGFDALWLFLTVIKINYLIHKNKELLK